MNSKNNTNRELKDDVSVSGILLTGALIFVSFATIYPYLKDLEVENTNCSINKLHAHLYEDENGIMKYITNEESKVGNIHEFYKKKDIINLKEEDKDLLDFINQNELYEIELNTDYLKNLMEEQKDFIEFEYSKNNDLEYDWTVDTNEKELTGNVRKGHYQYMGAKVVKTGDYYMIECSDLVDDIFDISEDYPYYVNSTLKYKYATFVDEEENSLNKEYAIKK